MYIWQLHRQVAGMERGKDGVGNSQYLHYQFNIYREFTRREVVTSVVHSWARNVTKRTRNESMKAIQIPTVRGTIKHSHPCFRADPSSACTESHQIVVPSCCAPADGSDESHLKLHVKSKKLRKVVLLPPSPLTPACPATFRGISGTCYTFASQRASACRRRRKAGKQAS